VSLANLVVNRTATDRSGCYMPTVRLSSQTDLVAAHAWNRAKGKRRPESYSKPALRSYKSCLLVLDLVVQHMV